MNIQAISEALGIIIQSATVIGLIYTLYKFADKPNKTQDERLSSLESRMDEVYKKLEANDIHSEMVDEGIRVIQKSLLAIMEHAINGNNTETLKDARNKLERYLIEK